MATTSQPQSEAGLKESFFRYFQQESAALQQQMDRLKTATWQPGERNNAVDECLAGIERLNHEVKDASSYIPAYDRRSYAETIKSLSDKLQTIRNQFAPPKKFSFKSRKTNPVPAPASSNSPTFIPSTTTNSRQSAQRPSQPTQEPPKPVPDSNTITISNRTQELITLPSSSSTTTPSSSSPSGPPSGTISHITHSILNLPPTTQFATLTLLHTTTSLLTLPPITGPLHITSLTNSILIAACHQFRMHASKNVTVYLHCSSRPIIEDCEGIRFAPSPEFFLEKMPALAGSTNRWDQIDDFKWLKFEPSPHFSLLPPEERIKDEVWNDLFTTKEGTTEQNIDDTLKAVGVSVEHEENQEM